MKKMFWSLLLTTVSTCVFSQGILSSYFLKQGVKWNYKGTINRTASTENLNDTTYDVNFSIEIKKVLKSKGDTTWVLINNFFDNIVFPKYNQKETNRILVFVPNSIFINKFEIDVDNMKTSPLILNAKSFNILITKSRLLENKAYTKEFNKYVPFGTQNVEYIKGSPRKIIKLDDFQYDNRRTNLALNYSSDICFYNYLFEFSGGKASYGSFELVSIEK